MTTLIFPAGGGLFRQCHAPTLVETPAGLVVAWFGGQREGSPDAGIWLARQNGRGWSEPMLVASGVGAGPAGPAHPGHVVPGPCWNPVLFRLGRGALALFFKVGPTARGWEGWLALSPDEGLSWGRPRPLGQGPLGPLIGPAKNKPIQRADGVLLCPSSTESKSWLAHMEATRDLEHWEVFGPVADPSGLGAIQPTLLCLPNGDLLALCRTYSKVIAGCKSRDGGRTWSRLSATPLKNPDSGIDAVTLKDGRLLLVYNDSDQIRTPLVAAVSRDGKSWRPIRVLENGPGEYSYPAVIQGSDGAVHVVYTWRRQAIAYARMPAID